MENNVKGLSICIAVLCNSFDLKYSNRTCWLNVFESIIQVHRIQHKKASLRESLTSRVPHGNPIAFDGHCYTQCTRITQRRETRISVVMCAFINKIKPTRGPRGSRGWSGGRVGRVTQLSTCGSCIYWIIPETGKSPNGLPPHECVLDHAYTYIYSSITVDISLLPMISCTGRVYQTIDTNNNNNSLFVLRVQDGPSEVLLLSWFYDFLTTRKTALGSKSLFCRSPRCTRTLTFRDSPITRALRNVNEKTPLTVFSEKHLKTAARRGRTVSAGSHDLREPCSGVEMEKKTNNSDNNKRKNENKKISTKNIPPGLGRAEDIVRGNFF